jgi:hypothetical protein
VHCPTLVATALVALLLGSAANRATAAGQSIVVATSVEQIHDIDPAQIEQLPAVDEKISFQTGRGPEQATYTGALLWLVLERAKMLGGDTRAHARRTILVTGRDGYVAVLGLAEIDPELEGKRVLLAYRRDGQPIDRHALRLIVPGDRHGARSVRDVVRIDVH